MIAYAQGEFVQGVIGKFVEIIINPLIYILATASLLVFLYGIVEFLAQGNNPAKASIGKQHMFWGIIGLFIFMASVGILRLIANTVGSSAEILTN